MGWWTGDPQERYWLEATDRDDIGADLRAPLSDSGGNANWRYTLFREARLGDIVFHYHGKAGAITARSVIAGLPFEQPIVWSARGSYARERGAVPQELPGYAIPLRDHALLPEQLSLERLRAERDALVALTDVLRERYPRKPLYFPFELSGRPVRPMQGYAFKLPAAFVEHFALDPDRFPSPLLTISSDRRKVSRQFASWRSALLHAAERSKGLWRQPAERFVFRNQDDPHSEELGPRTALGVDPLGRDWAVQINEAAEAGDLDITSAIAFDPDDRPLLVRQGRLAPNALNRTPILYSDFARLSGLLPARVSNGYTAIPRDWYVVTPLDVSPEDICRNTARFVDACVLARMSTGRADPSADSIALGELRAGDEAGGHYLVGAQPAREARQLRRLQGEVWMAMAALLRGAGLTVEKPRHAEGYEVDAEITGCGRRLLVEIKSALDAADVHTGIGQLLLYPALLPRLAGHRRILLLPALPRAPLVEAIESCQVTLCTYRLIENNGAVDVTFSRDFLDACGL